MKPIFIIDVDGVMTTGQFIYSVDGKCCKVFGPHDADGLKAIKDEVDIYFITADRRGFLISKKRIDDMGYPLMLVGGGYRYEYIRQTFGFDNTIFMGDGINDVPVLKECMMGIAPQNARREAKEAAGYVTPSRSAEGAVCDACLEIKRKLLVRGSIFVERIDSTSRYSYDKIIMPIGASSEWETASELQTSFVHEGQVNLEVDKTGSVDKVSVRSGEGYCVVPGVRFRLVAEEQCMIFRVSSRVLPGKPVVEIIDDGETQREEIIDDYKVINNPKRVDKPWGHELWIMWTKHHHVMKQIGMKKDQRCSLQFHEKKLETNYLVEGEAEVLDGPKVDVELSKEQIIVNMEEADFNKFMIRKTPGMHFTFSPGTVHRVTAVEDYIAYEVSTTELDDVVRLSDDSNRQSGRIVREHLVKEKYKFNAI